MQGPISPRPMTRARPARPRSCLSRVASPGARSRIMAGGLHPSE
jgi:hypothetical protein